MAFLPPADLMEYRRLGHSDLRTPVIGLGCWTLGGQAYGPVEKDAAIRTMHAALDLGITLFDTSPAYGPAEEYIGEALNGRRHEVILVTKCGRGPYTRHNVVASLDQSLIKLRTDHVDLYLLNWPEAEVPLEESILGLRDTLEAGKVGYVGVCNRPAEMLREAVAWGPLVTNQVGYSLFERRWEKAVFSTCAELGIGIMAYSPLAQGLLSGHVSGDTTYHPEDFRARGIHLLRNLFTPENLPRNLAVVERLKAFAAERGGTIAQLALAWVLTNPLVGVALVGSRHPNRLAEDVDCQRLRLTPSDMQELEMITRDAAGITDDLPLTRR